MITLLTIEPVSDAHGALIVEAFNMLFIDSGGRPDSNGDGVGYGNGRGDGRGDGCGYSWSDGRGDGRGDGYGYGYGYGNGDSWDNFSVNVPEEWRSE